MIKTIYYGARNTSSTELFFEQVDDLECNVYSLTRNDDTRSESFICCISTSEIDDFINEYTKLIDKFYI